LYFVIVRDKVVEGLGLFEYKFLIQGSGVILSEFFRNVNTTRGNPLCIRAKK
jgi:hypothetical protein